MKITYEAIEKRFEKFVSKYTKAQQKEVRRVVLDLLLAEAESKEKSDANTLDGTPKE